MYIQNINHESNHTQKDNFMFGMLKKLRPIYDLSA